MYKSINIDEFISYQKKESREIVAVIGLGFVGSVMGGVVASTRKHNRNLYGVIGIDLNNEEGLKKINHINSGNSPVLSNDEELDTLFKQSVKEDGSYIATYNYDYLKYANIVIIDINLDVKKEDELRKSKAVIKPFKKAIREVGKNINKECLVLIETTVPPGTVKHIAEPILHQKFNLRGIEEKPLIAHSYERVMPGPNYVNSIRNYWRVYSGNCKKAEERAGEFLESIIDTNKYPLTKLNDTNASELSKILENTYRAVNIAFIYEWTLLSEKIGVNLFDIVSAIRKREKTHNNIMKPGVGVGGYCLPKDPILAQWASKEIFNLDLDLSFSMEAVMVNDKMPLHIVDLVTENIDAKDKKVLICGVTYIENVADTRNTPVKLIYKKLQDLGYDCCFHDTMVEECIEIPKAKFISKNALEKDISNYDIVLFLVRHTEYMNLDVEKLFKSNDTKTKLIIDGFDIINDFKIKALLRKGITVAGVGKGHINSMKEEMKNE